VANNLPFLHAFGDVLNSLFLQGKLLLEGIGIHQHQAMLMVHALAKVLPIIRKAQPQGRAFLFYRIQPLTIH
jgi:hypothetical protein